MIKGTVSGFQLGFVNLVDSVSEGVALGFLSYVKRGGYRAIDVSSNELYPVNIGFKKAELHLHVLCSEIGERRVGSEANRKSTFYVESILKEAGVS